MRARSAQATVRAPLGKGAATLTISRSLMTKKRSVYRTSLHLGKVIVQTRINIQGVVLDIPPGVEGGVKLPKRLDQWGAESAPAYRALIGLSFLWHEPGRTHAPKGGKWLRRTSIDPYEPIDDDDAIDLTYPSSRKSNRHELARRAWAALEALEEYGELQIDGKRILPPDIQRG